jgi:hypothetical protein
MKGKIMHTSLYSVCSEAIRILNVNSVPESSIVNLLARNGIATIQKLKETDIDQISNFRYIGATYGIISKMKDLIEYDPIVLASNSTIVYAYSLMNDTFSSHEGMLAGTKNSRFGIFRSEDHYNASVTMTPGKIYNGVLWLPVKNDEEAKKLFVFYFTNKNEELKRQITLNNKKLQILKDA